MQDSRFANSVLLITSNDLEGTRAICLNKDVGATVNGILKHVDKSLIKDQKVFWGGPVAGSTLWMLHDHGWKIDASVLINDQWLLTSTYDMLDHVNEGHGPRHKRFFLGVSSWAPGQLDMEIEGETPWNKDSSWLIATAPPPEEIFALAPSDLWLWSCELSAQQTVKDWI
jgi:putative transcriptional regulator